MSNAELGALLVIAGVVAFAVFVTWLYTYLWLTRPPARRGSQRQQLATRGHWGVQPARVDKLSPASMHTCPRCGTWTCARWEAAGREWVCPSCGTTGRYGTRSAEITVPMAGVGDAT